MADIDIGLLEDMLATSEDAARETARLRDELRRQYLIVMGWEDRGPGLWVKDGSRPLGMDSAVGRQIQARMDEEAREDHSGPGAAV